LVVDERAQVADVMRRLYERGLVSARGGNASILGRDGLIYISPSGHPRHLIGPEHVAVIRPDGSVVEGRPSSEWRMHVEVYRRIPGARAVVHAHGSMAVAAAAAGIPLRTSTLTEAAYSLGECGEVPVVPPVRPGTWELARAVAEALAGSGCRGAVLAGHGMVAYSGETIYHALDAVEAIEELARVEATLALLSGRRPL
jgi:L-fuculose-phosphate aldolase